MQHFSSLLSIPKQTSDKEKRENVRWLEFERKIFILSTSSHISTYVNILKEEKNDIRSKRIMSSANEAADALPSDFDVGGLTNAFNNPTQAFRMLDKNGDGRVTKEDLQILLQGFGINGMAAKILSKYIFKQLDANNNGTIEPSDLTHANGILSSLMKMKQGGGGHH